MFWGISLLDFETRQSKRHHFHCIGPAPVLRRSVFCRGSVARILSARPPVPSILANRPVRNRHGAALRPPTSKSTGFRNIPTGVGRSLALEKAKAMGTEHPHGGGEKMHESQSGAAARGTSPRGWGEASHRHTLVMRLRNIPTGVGRRR